MIQLLKECPQKSKSPERFKIKREILGWRQVCLILQLEFDDRCKLKTFKNTYCIE